MRSFLLFSSIIAFTLFVGTHTDCGKVYGQTTTPSTQPDALAAALAQIQALSAAQQQQINALQTQLGQTAGRNADLTVALNSATLNLNAYRTAAASIVPPGTDLGPLMQSGPAGDYYGVPKAKYPLTGSPTRQLQAGNQRWHMRDCEVDITPAIGASAAFVFETVASTFEGAKLVRVGGDYAVVRIRGAGRDKGLIVAPGYPLYYGQGNVVRDCEFDASMTGIVIHGTAAGTVIENNIFHKIQQCAIYDCGLQSTILHNYGPEGSQGEHMYRGEIDGTLQATDTGILFNYWDNRTSPARKEDITLRMGDGSVVMGNTLMGWGAQGQQGFADGKPHGSPSYWRSNSIPNPHANLVNGQMTYGAIVQGNTNNTLYFDHNWINVSPNASAVTVFAAGNLLTRENILVRPPAVYLKAFAAIDNGPTPFVGRLLEVGAGNVIQP